jgi:hypothetical protein
VANEEKKYLYTRLTKTQLATIDNDAKSCYDRIICNLAMMVSQYYGIPNQYCKVQSNTLRNSKYNLRTALGDSVVTYQHSEITPIHGTGQGSCASPAIWLMMSCLLMDIFEKKAHGMKIYNIFEDSPILLQYIEAFVGDASSFTNTEFENTCVNTILTYLKEDGYLWTK